MTYCSDSPPSSACRRSNVREAVERTRSGEVAALPEFEIDADTAYLIMEQRATLPGVTVRALPVRGYTRGALMGHVLGHMGLPSPGDLERLPISDTNTPIGKLGVESEYGAVPARDARQARVPDQPGGRHSRGDRDRRSGSRGHGPADP